MGRRHRIRQLHPETVAALLENMQFRLQTRIEYRAIHGKAIGRRHHAIITSAAQEHRRWNSRRAPTRLRSAQAVRRAMAVIAEVEAAPRGLYTGSIGRIDANGDAMFNVAIRTLAIAGDSATLGLGSGIVADSTAGDEWAECAAKGAFVTAGQRRFDLIETMAFDPEAGIPRLERHLARMKASADALGFTFDRHDTRNELQAATFRL
eukprot:gene40054-54151_t